MLQALGRLFAQTSLYLRLFVLQAALFIRQTIIYRTSPSRNARTALLIGDVNALGLGDDLGNLGLATRLTALLRDPAEPQRPRFFWHVLTAGVLRARAADWAPGAPGRLFERTLIRGPFRRAEVVIVLLGAHDDAAAGPDALAQRVARIAEGIVRLGKHAVVATLPNTHPPQSDAHAAVRDANRLLRAALEDVKSKNSAPACGTLAWDVDMAKIIAMGNHVVRFESDFVGLNASGFRLLAREVYDAFVLSARRAEWADIKGIIS